MSLRGEVVRPLCVFVRLHSLQSSAKILQPCDSAVNSQPLDWYNLLLSDMELLSQSSQTHFLDLRKNICAKWHEAMLQ